MKVDTRPHRILPKNFSSIFNLKNVSISRLADRLNPDLLTPPSISTYHFASYALPQRAVAIP